MKITTNGQNTIRVRMNEDINFAIQDDLIKTREKFLEYIGQLFDKAIYDSLSETGGEDISEERELRSKAMIIDEYSHIPNTLMMQVLEEGKESCDTLREIYNYVQDSR